MRLLCNDQDDAAFIQEQNRIADYLNQSTKSKLLKVVGKRFRR